MTYWSMPAATAASTSAIAPSPSIFFGLPKFSASLSGAPIAWTTYGAARNNVSLLNMEAAETSKHPLMPVADASRHNPDLPRHCLSGLGSF